MAEPWQSQNGGALLAKLLEHIHLQEIDGVPVQVWMNTQRAKEIERVLMAMGDMSPSAHDAVRAAISEAMKKTGTA